MPRPRAFAQKPPLLASVRRGRSFSAALPIKYTYIYFVYFFYCPQWRIDSFVSGLPTSAKLEGRFLSSTARRGASRFFVVFPIFFPFFTSIAEIRASPWPRSSSPSRYRRTRTRKSGGRDDDEATMAPRGSLPTPQPPPARRCRGWNEAASWGAAAAALSGFTLQWSRTTPPPSVQHRSDYHHPLKLHLYVHNHHPPSPPYSHLLHQRRYIRIYTHTCAYVCSTGQWIFTTPPL